MTVNPGSLITAANYNSLQQRVATILGGGFGGTGYGQDPLSAPVGAEQVVRAEHMELLRDDINRIHVHQFGSVSPLKEIFPGTTIGANEIDGDTDRGFNEYVSLVSILEANADQVDGTQVTRETALTSSRFSSWNGKIVHSFTVTFNDDGHRRAFFNAGGAIEITANIDGDNSPKGNDWNTMLFNMGTITFKKSTTEKTGFGGIVQPIGNFNLTSTLTLIFERRGQADYYFENRYFIFAREVTNRSIQFVIEFIDNDEGDPSIDELVSGTISSVIKQLRPTGPAVSIPSPSYSTQSSLDQGN